LVASQPADWDRAKALDVTTNILQRNPDLKAIYAANDTMALGALQAVKNADKLGKILVVGTDGAPEAIDSVKHHELTATAAQNSASIGAKSVDILLDALKNKPAIKPDNEPAFIAIDSNLVTQ
jgi:D-allose transport system substrate-binding protein